MLVGRTFGTVSVLVFFSFGRAVDLREPSSICAGLWSEGLPLAVLEPATCSASGARDGDRGQAHAYTFVTDTAQDGYYVVYLVKEAMPCYKTSYYR